MTFKGTKSKFETILNLKRSIYFNFYKDSEFCYFPVHSSLAELLGEGWVIDEE